MEPTPSAGSDPSRPTLACDPADSREAHDAVEQLIEELQQGWDEHDADITDRRLADDVLWGSPFGATVRGYESLHEIHLRLKKQGVGGPSSRFELVQMVVPSPDVAVAHVRRVALGPEGDTLAPAADLSGPFSEMALYVLAKRNGTWWLAGGQNTPVRPLPSEGTSRPDDP
jgi:uncharacterized protein (TIGR02246 family)